jgi:hypothetical protein
MALDSRRVYVSEQNRNKLQVIRYITDFKNKLYDKLKENGIVGFL